MAEPLTINKKLNLPAGTAGSQLDRHVGHGWKHNGPKTTRHLKTNPGKTERDGLATEAGQRTCGNTRTPKLKATQAPELKRRRQNRQPAQHKSDAETNPQKNPATATDSPKTTRAMKAWPTTRTPPELRPPNVTVRGCPLKT